MIDPTLMPLQQPPDPYSHPWMQTLLGMLMRHLHPESSMYNDFLSAISVGQKQPIAAISVGQKSPIAASPFTDQSPFAAIEVGARGPYA